MSQNTEDVDGAKPLNGGSNIRPIGDMEKPEQAANSSPLKDSLDSQEEELDEFGLPVSKLAASSRRSSRSDSFESARSSIDMSPRWDASKSSHDEDDVADVEDNDVEDFIHGRSMPAMEWPRLSQSTLPGTGHVKSSPFHNTPHSKPSVKETVYAERAKELIKVSPVSNSVFRRQDSPIVESPLSRSSFKAISTKTDQKPENPIAPGHTPTESAPQLQPEEPSINNPPSGSTPDPEKSNPEQPNESSTLKISANVHHSPNSSLSANVFFDSPDESAHNPAGASEWSHQLAVAQAEAHTPDASRKSLDNDGWQEMPAYAAYDVYDDEGRLVAKQFVPSDDDEEDKGGAGKGYTRMNQDEDAQSADSMDENTQYLFTESLDDEDAKTPLSQMQATKEMLTEGQRIAYVGLCKLTLAGMLRDVGRVRYKENRAAYESMTLWSQKMMIRLFGHMDISPDGYPMKEFANCRTSND